MYTKVEVRQKFEALMEAELQLFYGGSQDISEYYQRVAEFEKALGISPTESEKIFVDLEISDPFWDILQQPDLTTYNNATTSRWVNPALAYVPKKFAEWYEKEMGELYGMPACYIVAAPGTGYGAPYQPFISINQTRLGMKQHMAE